MEKDPFEECTQATAMYKVRGCSDKQRRYQQRRMFVCHDVPASHCHDVGPQDRVAQNLPDTLRPEDLLQDLPTLRTDFFAIRILGVGLAEIG
jgi:hypothetical protein